MNSSLGPQTSTLTLPNEVYWIAVFGYATAVLIGFYAICHVIILELRLER